jgi:chemotaxis protein histidine kinase CheA
VRVQVEDDGRGVNARKVLAKARANGLAVPDSDEVTSEDLLKILAHPGFRLPSR